MADVLQWRRLVVIATGAVGFLGLFCYLFLLPEEPEKPKREDKKKRVEVAEKLNLEELDPEERKLLEEIKKKGYYHGRPKSEATAAPARLGGAPAEGGREAGDRRTEFDDFQRKWDKFGSERFVEKL
mmetsp:Transcript_86173/g.252128  ORF Transcript_86173/g.252128 Transcript_86173/m.252128 type:complete len:127 (-) Transcript_86173:166-546(-)